MGLRYHRRTGCNFQTVLIRNDAVGGPPPSRRLNACGVGTGALGSRTASLSSVPAARLANRTVPLAGRREPPGRRRSDCMVTAYPGQASVLACGSVLASVRIVLMAKRTRAEFQSEKNVFVPTERMKL